LSGPLSNRIEASLDAYKTTTPYPIFDLTTDHQTTQDVYGARAKLKFLLTDDLDITLMGYNQNTVGKGFNFTYIYITPGNTFLFPGSPFTQAVMLPGIKLGWDNLDYTSPVTQAGSTYRDTDYSMIINDRLPGGYTLTSTTAYTQENQHQVQDLFAVNEYFWKVLTGSSVFNNTQQQLNTVQQSSEELKIVSPTEGPFNWLAGLFYSDTKVNELLTRTLPPAALDYTVVPTTQTYDLYARATWKLASTTSLVTGLRFNHDLISYTYNQILPAPSYYSAGSAANNSLVGDIALKQQFTSDLMGYLSYSRGYSPAAYNTAATLTSSAPLVPVSRENINSVEIGTKGTYFDHKLTLNADIFDTVYKDYQIQTYGYTPGELAPPYVLASAGQAQTHGLELEVNWLATPMTHVVLNAAYIDATFGDYKNASCYGTEPPVTITQVGAQPPNGVCGQLTVAGVRTGSPYQNLSGDTMPNAPKFKANISIQQRVPLSSIPYQWMFEGESIRGSRRLWTAQPERGTPKYGWALFGNVVCEEPHQSCLLHRCRGLLERIMDRQCHGHGCCCDWPAST
jgi:iron complex outermembrane receptor protein